MHMILHVRHISQIAWFASLAVVLLALGVLIAAEGPPAESQAAAPSTVAPVLPTCAQPTRAYSQDFGTWNYTVSRDAEGEQRGTIDSDHSSVQALEAYVATNRALAQELAQTGTDAEVTVTFRAPVPLSRYRVWISQQRMKVAVVGIRYIDGNGLRAGAGVVPTADGQLPSDARLGDGALRAYTVEGVMNLRGTVPASHLLLLGDDPLVFLADCSIAAARRNLAQAGFADAQEIPFDLGSPFSQMEDLGLENFK